jgi:hypothetical protein
MQVFTLTSHPSTPTDTVRRLDAEVDRRPDGLLFVTFRLVGQLDRLRIPAAGVPRLGARLWAHTCFEAFVAVADAAAYHEFNFAPSGEWTVYAFSRYREGGPVHDPALAPGIVVRRTENQLELVAQAPLSHLSPRHRDAVLRLGLAAVVEAQDGTHSYWALRHPPGRPDFHHPDAFAVTLERAPTA